MMFDRLALLLNQAHERGELPAPPLESAFKVSAAERQVFRFGHALLNLALLVIGAAIMLSGSMVSLFWLFCSTSTSPGGLLVIFVFCILMSVASLMSGVKFMRRIDRLITAKFPSRTMTVAQNIHLCMPLVQSECVTMLSLFENVRGGHAYHQKILGEGRQVYGFDLALLQRVSDVRASRAALLEKQQENLRHAQIEKEACRRIHGIV